jgi:hypothetical protein
LLHQVKADLCAGRRTANYSSVSCVAGGAKRNGSLK